jgi:hypothetical protein
MRQFRFQVLEMKDTSSQEWLRVWSARYSGYDEKVYADLIAKHKSFSAEDFERIGKWKDGVTRERQWKQNVASVAYLIWKQAAKELPKCPGDSDLAAFLDDWSGRRYTDVFPNKSVEKRFGLSRATTLLHFVSGGRYPIFDSRVKTAVARLLKSQQLPGTVSTYLHSVLPIFKELADCCGCDTMDDLRTLDKALFSYGALEADIFAS